MNSRLRRVLVGAGVLGGALLLPEPRAPAPDSPQATPFVWDRDGRWRELEAQFVQARTAGCEPGLERELAELEARIDDLGQTRPDDARWNTTLEAFFRLAAGAGGCPASLEGLLQVREHLRRTVKRASIDWSGDAQARRRVYTLLYGTRMATEELILQMTAGTAPDRTLVEDVASATPRAEVEGVTLHSGDLLLSRGGAPTSAFIARGNDYPGNFSHVALVHVDPDGGKVSIIESHIERGVAISTVEQYLADKKLRILLLRMRSDHPALLEDPQLPHRAAAASLDAVRAGHIPYDFEMDFTDPSEQFCSEVVSAAYRGQGVELWSNLSTFSSPGLARWMASFGVEHLETQSPSDLEYDPQLAVVAEWHGADTLLDDHIDNAVIDAMLEQAEAGAEVEHAWPMVPVARLAKAYSLALNAFGGVGPVPEGMSATVALRATWLAERHGEIRRGVEGRIAAYESTHGYRPPYWKLVAMAREAAAPTPAR